MLVLIVLMGLPLVSLLQHAADISPWALLQSRYIRNVITFSFWQAGLSTLLAVGLSIPLAHALARQTLFPGRKQLLQLFSVSLVLPTIVAVFGLVAVFGNNGWLTMLFNRLGVEADYSLYGLSGILLAHVFFNLPLSTRILLQSLERIPSESWRLSSQLGMNAFDSFRLIQWPQIRSVLPGVALLVFSLCFTSFAIVMTLGGGPRATTIEVAIYQSLRFDFELETAVGLAMLQTLFCSTLMLLNARFGQSAEITYSQGTTFQRRDGRSTSAKCLDFALILPAALLVCLPLLAIILAGLTPALTTVVSDPAFLKALLSTLMVSLTAGALSILMAASLLASSTHIRIRFGRHMPGRILELSGSLILVVPPLVLGTGLFLMLRNYADVFALALPLTILVNGLMGLPFALRILENPLLMQAVTHDRLCASLGIRGFNRLKVIDWPMLRQPLGLALAVCCTLAAGDLTVIALFGSQEIRTLPLLLYQRMGSYQLQEAAVTALLLLLYCLILFRLLERIVGGKVEKDSRHATA